MPSFIFDLDGTLVDTVYAHVGAWQRAFADAGMAVSGWRIHRRIGMSGDVFIREAAEETGREILPDEAAAIKQGHEEWYKKLLPVRTPLPGAKEFLLYLKNERIPYGIATSGTRPGIVASLEALGVNGDTVVVERAHVKKAKPDPELFLLCAEKLRQPAHECIVVGDAVWDFQAAQRAGMKGIGVLSGGTGSAELLGSGASRLFDDMRHLHRTMIQEGLGPFVASAGTVIEPRTTVERR